MISKCLLKLRTKIFYNFLNINRKIASFINFNRVPPPLSKPEFSGDQLLPKVRIHQKLKNIHLDNQLKISQNFESCLPTPTVFSDCFSEMTSLWTRKVKIHTYWYLIRDVKKFRFFGPSLSSFWVMLGRSQEVQKYKFWFLSWWRKHFLNFDLFSPPSLPRETYFRLEVKITEETNSGTLKPEEKWEKIWE